MRGLYLKPHAQGSVSRGLSRFAFITARMINGSNIVEHKITAIRGVETILPKGEVIDEAPRLATYPLLEVIEFTACMM